MLPHHVSAIAGASAASAAAQKRVERASKGQWFEPGVVRFVLHVAVRHGAGARRTGAERPRMHLLRTSTVLVHFTTSVPLAVTRN